MTRDQILVVACHEAAHAFVAWKLGVPVDEAVVVAAEIADGEPCGYARRGACLTQHAILISLAGGMAERRVTHWPIMDADNIKVTGDVAKVAEHLIRLFPNSENQTNAMKMAVTALLNAGSANEALTRLPVTAIKMLQTTDWFNPLCRMASEFWHNAGVTLESIIDGQSRHTGLQRAPL